MSRPDIDSIIKEVWPLVDGQDKVVRQAALAAISSIHAVCCDDCRERIETLTGVMYTEVH